MWYYMIIFFYKKFELMEVKYLKLKSCTDNYQRGHYPCSSQILKMLYQFISKIRLVHISFQCIIIIIVTQ
jgi:hypothetical protein